MDNKVIYIEDKSQENLKKESKFSFKKIDFKKFLSPKFIKIAVLIILGLVGGFILLGSTGQKSKSTSSTITKVYGYRSTMDYCAELESKLKLVLSKVKGAGNIEVMISLDGSPEIVYASDTDEKETTSTSGTSTKSKNSNPIIVSVNGSNEPLILTEILPAVKGVIIVSSGAKDIGVKLDILNAVSILLDISDDKITVLNGI